MFGRDVDSVNDLNTHQCLPDLNNRKFLQGVKFKHVRMRIGSTNHNIRVRGI